MTTLRISLCSYLEFKVSPTPLKHKPAYTVHHRLNAYVQSIDLKTEGGGAFFTRDVHLKVVSIVIVAWGWRSPEFQFPVRKRDFGPNYLRSGGFWSGGKEERGRRPRQIGVFNGSKDVIYLWLVYLLTLCMFLLYDLFKFYFICKEAESHYFDLELLFVLSE